ncbi:uncharacterized protein LOC108735749 [Agrilus planipennis]|uniref:Uncharacterized protein LOC108735749 n=1 Tax=Agrilus planipennis TaxID=224129 RepID=A0A1W4WHG3_AGRPL|nr:uncharacterized protein LOC108735749 [Agrilus planipennis]
MSNPKMVSNAQRKNKIKSAELEADLDRLEKERKGEIRNYNTIKQRFKAKHAKLDYYAGKAEDIPEVRMYETHNPGFCYKRNGECRIPQMSISAPVVDYQELHNMLFTNDDLDIEKVLCLHLLTAHRFEMLAPVVKPVGYVSKDQCPLERLLERSKRRKPENRMVKMLPLYVLDVQPEDQPPKRKPKTDVKVQINDDRLNGRILINEKIQTIITTVLTALNSSSPSKLKTLVTTAENPKDLEKVLEKSECQMFIRDLQHQTIVTSCESFYLIQSSKIMVHDLKVSSNLKILETVLDSIRFNVLQYPTKKQTTRRTSEDIDGSSIPYAKSTKSTHSSYVSIPMSATASVAGKFLASTSKKDTSETNTFIVEKLISTASSSKDVRKKLSREISIVKPLNKLPEYEDEISSIASVEVLNKDNTKGNISLKEAKVLVDIDYDLLADLLSKKTNRAIQRDLAKLKEKIEEHECEKSCETQSDSISGGSILEHARVSIRRLNCPACLLKWKNPYPIPKTPKRISIPQLDQNNYKSIRTDSMHIISTIIDRELLKLEADRENEKKRKTLTSSPVEEERKFSRAVLETVNLNAIDLAKINQEIRERETQSKLEKFLKGEQLEY